MFDTNIPCVSRSARSSVSGLREVRGCSRRHQRCPDLTAAPYRFPGAYVLDIQGTGERLRTLLIAHQGTVRPR